MAGKGNPKTGGRKKGSPNKITTSIKDAISKSFDEVGGAAYLVRVAHEDPKTYLTLVGKIIPAELNAKVEGGLNLKVVSGIEGPPGSDADS